MPPEPTATVIRQERSPSLEVSNAYYLSMSLQNVRCFGETQILDLQSAPGTPARWTLILGENGVGKTTLMQLLALGAADVVDQDYPRLAINEYFRFSELIRTGQEVARVTYDVRWADSFDPGRESILDETSVEGDGQWKKLRSYRPGKRSLVYGYGANRRRAPRGLTAETSDHPTQTLFDDDATLRNPEEWLLQNELVANTNSPLKEKAQRQRERVLGILTRILPGIDEIRVSSRDGANHQVRASKEAAAASSPT